jgi:transcription elongation factor Elf1
MFDFNTYWIEISCPYCNYQEEIQLGDAKGESTIFCHNCKLKISLVDEDGSVHTGINTFNNLFEDFRNLFNKH